MMSTVGPSLAFFWVLHILSVVIFIVGVAFLLFWSFKRLTEPQLWTWGWIFVAVGTISCLLAIVGAPSIAFSSRFDMPSSGSRFGMMGREAGARAAGMPMMFYEDEELLSDGTDEAAQAKEEADGKALYDKLAAKQTTCVDLSDADFELIGEYFMSQRLGASHERMNAMMRRMMGQEGEEQMHAILGRHATGCTQASAQ